MSRLQALRERTADYDKDIARHVAEAPPLSAAQRDRIANLLRGQK